MLRSKINILIKRGATTSQLGRMISGGALGDNGDGQVARQQASAWAPQPVSTNYMPATTWAFGAPIAVAADNSAPCA